MESIKESLEKLNLEKHGIISTTKEKCTVCNYGMVITVVSHDGEMSRCKYCEDKKLVEEMNIPMTKEGRDNLRVSARASHFNHIPNDLEDVTLNEYVAESDEQKQLKNKSAEFIFSFDKTKSLVISGAPGIGKSHVAVSIAKALSKDHSVLFLKSGDVLSLIRETYNNAKHTENEVFSIIRDVDLLVLDDIGAEYDKQNNNESWASDILFRILDSRLNKSNVITTNYTSSELIDKYGMNGQRIESRINDGADRIRVFGKDRRRKENN